MGPKLKDECYYDKKRCAYGASELISLISRSEKSGKPMKVGSFSVEDYEIPFPCSELCDFGTPLAGNADISVRPPRILSTSS